MNLQELEALIKLLEDEDQFVLSQVEGKLKEYFSTLPASIWPSITENASPIAKKRLEHLLFQFNLNYVIELAKTWINNPLLLTDALFFVARLFNFYLEYQEFLALIYRYSRHIPTDFAQNYSPLEQANYIVHVFFKSEKFEWFQQQPFYQYLNPEFVLKYHKGSNITIALIIVAFLQHFGINWLVVSDMSLTHTYITVPSTTHKGAYFFIDPRIGKILPEAPLAKKDMEQIIKSSIYDYNVLSLKSLIVAFLQNNVLPRGMDDIWYVINKINQFLSNFARK